MSRQQLKKYIFIIDAVRSAGERGVTLEELNEKWERSYRNDSGKPIPWRTFIDDRDAIAELFGIEITCDKRDNTYRIGGGWDEYGSVKNTLIDALVLNNAIRESPDLGGSIVFNDNFHQKCMPDFVRAIKEHRTIRFRYQRHDSIPKAGISLDYDRTVTFQPYGLYNSTLWFTVGKNLTDGKLHIYALHRLSEIEFLDETFAVPEDFSVKQYMSIIKSDKYDYNRIDDDCRVAWGIIQDAELNNPTLQGLVAEKTLEYTKKQMRRIQQGNIWNEGLYQKEPTISLYQAYFDVKDALTKLYGKPQKVKEKKEYNEYDCVFSISSGTIEVRYGGLPYIPGVTITLTDKQNEKISKKERSQLDDMSKENRANRANVNVLDL